MIADVSFVVDEIPEGKRGLVYFSWKELARTLSKCMKMEERGEKVYKVEAEATGLYLHFVHVEL